MSQPYDLIQSDIVFRGRVFEVRRDEVRLPGGKITQLDIVRHHGAVTLVPVDQSGHIWFVRQYRHAAGEYILELPAGTLEEGEAPEVCAQREVREEIGMAASSLLKIGEFYLAPGYSTEYMIVFLATGLKPAPLVGDADEILSVERLKIDQAYRLAKDGRIQDAKSLAALLLARPYLETAIGVDTRE